MDTINEYQRLYELTENPLFAWAALHALTHEQRIPNWVLDYLRRAAAYLAERKPEKRATSEHVAKALGFAGTGRASDYQQFGIHELAVAVEVCAGDTPTEQIKDAERVFGVSNRTVRRARARRRSLVSKRRP